MRLFEAHETLVPLRFELRAAVAAFSKLRQRLFRHIELWFCWPTVIFLCEFHLFAAQSLSVRLCRILAIGAAVTNVGPNANQRWPVDDGAGASDRFGECLQVVTII